MGRDVTEAGVRKEGVGKEAGEAVNRSPSLLTQPGCYQLLKELFTARLAQFSEKDYSNSLRKSYMQKH